MKRGAQYHVLVIDDVQADRRRVRQALHSKQYVTVLEASTIKEALLVIESMQATVILLDWNLESCPSGLDAIAALEKATKAPILICSGARFTDGMRQIILEHSHVGFIQKEELTPDHLAEKLKDVVRRRREQLKEARIW